MRRSLFRSNELVAISLIAFLAGSGCGYNDLQGLDEEVKGAWAEVQNQYQRRTAKALVVAVGRETLALPDELLNAYLDERDAAHFAAPGALESTRSLHPLPVLGVPGWAPGNEDAAFYDDATVFRPGRMRERKEAPSGASWSAPTLARDPRR